MNSFLYAIQAPFIWLLCKFHDANDWIATRLDGRGNTGKKSNILVLDGVRGVAVLMVISFHLNRVTGDNLWDKYTNPLASSFSTAGGTGVTLFFVLSGFLLFMPFAKALLFKTDWPLMRVFYMRRVLRIIPAYYVSLFILILLASPEYLHPDHFKNLFLFLAFFMDSARATFRQINGPYWTLAVEWQFYMLLPFIALGIAFVVSRVSTTRRRFVAVTACLVGIIICGLFIRYWGLYFLEYPTQTFLMPRSELNIINFFLFGITGKYTEDFAVGMFISLCFIYAQHPSTDKKVVQQWKRLSPWLWIGGLSILVFSFMWHYKAGEAWSWPFISDWMMQNFNWLSEMLLAIGFGACIAAILYGSVGLKAMFEWPMLRWVGLISFSLYIWHLPLLLLLQSRVLPMFHGLNRFVTYGMFVYWAIAVIFPFAFLSYLIVERPWMRLGDRWRVEIEKRHREKLNLEEKEAPAQGLSPGQAEAPTLQQEAVTK